MEQIVVRLTQASRSEVMDTLRRHLAEVRDTVALDNRAGGPTVRVSVYEHASIETDVCVQVESARVDGAGAHDMAVRMASGLKTVGIVQHTRWFSTVNGGRDEIER